MEEERQGLGGDAQALIVREVRRLNLEIKTIKRVLFRGVVSPDDYEKIYASLEFVDPQYQPRGIWG